MLSEYKVESKKSRKKENRNRRKKGDGGLRQLENGNWEGTEKIKKKSGGEIPKSVTRKNAQEVLLIKKHLKALEPLDDDVIKIEVNKLTNEITIIRASDNRNSRCETNDVDSNITVNDYVDYWLWNHRRNGLNGKRIKDSTFEDYVQKCDYIKQKLGTVITPKGEVIQVKVSNLTFKNMENAMLELNNEIVYESAIQVRNHLYNMMKFAKKDGVIKVNPFEDEKINLSNTKGKKERAIIQEKDISVVIQYILRLWYVDVLTQMITGGRAGEIRGLCWIDIIEDKCIVKFRNSYNAIKQFTYVDNHIVSQGRKRRYSTLKTDSSTRDIQIPEAYMRILIMHKELQKSLASRLGIVFKETDPVFTTNTYQPLGRNDTNDRVKKVVKDLQIENWEEITSHCLRHGFCYAGLLNDVPLEYMQILLGHSNISVTRKWYAHFDDRKINEYAVKVNKSKTEVINKINKGNWENSLQLIS